MSYDIGLHRGLYAITEINSLNKSKNMVGVDRVE